MKPYRKTNYSDRSVPAPTTRRKVDTAEGDFYVTPPDSTRALFRAEGTEDWAPGIKGFKGFRTAWEPACGDGTMAEVIKEFIPKVRATDINPRGYGEPLDFLQPTDIRAELIITNPPFHLAGEFLELALQRASKGVALFLRLAFLEGVERYERIYNVVPPTRVYVFSRRQTLYPAGMPKKGKGTTAYAWFVWLRPYRNFPWNPLHKTELEWLPD